MATNARKAAALDRGQAAEATVAAWYEHAGYTILSRNWQCFEGEIDIIACRERTLVVCEVKARRSTIIDPGLTITAAKQAKVRTAAFRWLAQNRHSGPLRFDVALVVNENVQVLEAAF